MAGTRRRSTERGTRSRRAAALALAAALAFGVPVTAGAGTAPLRDGPVVWFADDARPVPAPAPAERGLVPYAVEAFLGRPFSRFWNPVRLVRSLDGNGPAHESLDVNALDEVVDSAWFTNRIGLRPLSAAELAEGAAHGTALASGPDLSRGLVVLKAKSAGVTPGFTVRDGRGDVWLLKFDPPSHPGMTIRAGVVSNLLFHALGYNTPVDRVVTFTRDDLVLDGSITINLERGRALQVNAANLDSILAATNSRFDGRYHALASRYLDGRILGSFDDQGRREDDPNDLLPHEDRRELRALRVFGAWLNHFDLKRQNTLDVYVGAPGEGHVRHYLIDFASTLGTFGDRVVPRFGYEYGIDLFPILGRLGTLGLVEDDWARLCPPPDLPEVGIFGAEVFDPAGWKPDLPHSAMANLTRRDGYWAAKVLSAFTADDLRVVLRQGLYQDPRAEDYLLQALRARQAAIVGHWFERVPPLDFFVADARGVAFTDLATSRGFAPAGGTGYRYRLAAVDAERHGTRGPWVTAAACRIELAGADGQTLPGVPRPDAEHPFLVLEVQLDRGRGWSASTIAYLAPASGRIVAVDR
jgi:hypothetical protein